MGYSRIRSAVVVMVVLMVLAVSHLVAVMALPPIQDLNDREIGDDNAFNATADDMSKGLYAVLTRWMQIIIGSGVILWWVYREFRQQRATAAAPRGR